MKKAVLAIILTLIMTLGFSFSASAEEAAKETPALKSAHLLAEGYEAMLDEPPVPVGISNKDLGVDDLEPTNAEKLTIDVGNGKFNMTGGSFTGNHLSNDGQGAVRLLSGNSFLRISGTPVITGNDGGNVYVSNGSKIEIIGELNTGANISVNMKNPGVFTTGYGSHYNTESSVADPWNFFQSDDSENKWVLWNDTFSEAILGS